MIDFKCEECGMMVPSWSFHACEKHTSKPNDDWITDRLPTKDDGEIVLTWCHDRWTDMHYSRVLNGTVWMRQPPPYQPPPPEPDASLEADCTEVWEYFFGAECECDQSVGHVCELCHFWPKLKRIIAAARRWDAAMQQNDQRPDLEGRLPIVYNGKSAEEWYRLYCSETQKRQPRTEPPTRDFWIGCSVSGLGHFVPVVTTDKTSNGEHGQSDY